MSFTPTSGDPTRTTRAVAMSWHGVLFDRGRRSINGAARATFARWSVELSDAALLATRGPAGRPHIERLLSLAEVTEAFRRKHGHWPTPEDIDAMATDLESRLIEAAAAANVPNQDACEALRRLHARGVKTAVVCCTPRRLLGPQLAALEASGVPLDAIITADEACAPAPAPWGIFESARQLGLENASDLTFVDDCEDGVRAARNAGARIVALTTPGARPMPADAVIDGLDGIGRD